MAEEGTKIQGEEEGSSQNPNLQADKYEVAARKAGWKPEEEWDGASEDWVPAKEFVGRQKLYDKIHDLRNQLSRQASKFEKEMSKISGHFAKVQQVEYERAKKELQGQLAAAKEAGDVEAAVEIAGQIKDTEQDIKQAKQEQQQAAAGGPSPEFLAWQEKNRDWFQKDPEMTADAIAIGSGYAMANRDKGQEAVLDYVEKRIRKMYPEKFGKGNGSTRQEDKQVEDKVEGGGNRPAPKVKDKNKLSVSDLDDTELSVMRTLLKRGVLNDQAKKNNRTPQEEYLAQLAERKSAGGR